MFTRATKIYQLISNTLVENEDKEMPLGSIERAEFNKTLMECFLLRRIHADVLGKRKNFKQCHEIMKDQAELLNRLEPSTLKNYPVIAAMHWEHTIPVYHANNKSVKQKDEHTTLISTPELAQSLKNLSLDPSGILKITFKFTSV